ncbi:MAG: hypothetical protein LBM75_11525 [Myxococcales bacterium]|jgi:hypothetical protein|nr:hypothetical protein [Myxococcales bacterium]
MDSNLRARFNAAFTPELYARYLQTLASHFGPIPFRVAETPLFFTPELRDRFIAHALDLAAQLSTPEMIACCKKAIPPRFDAPNMDALPNTVQVDFAVVPGARDGQLDGRLIELQGFPSLYAFMVRQADLWAEELDEIEGLREPWTALCAPTRAQGLDLLGRTLLGGCDPLETVLVDIDPPSQKTFPDFVATQELFGIEPVCVTQLIRRGNKLFRKRGGQEIQVKRIYNRLVFDELIAKKVETPFDFRDELDVTFCSHPNWYWAWSKFCLPLLDHPSVPRARLLSSLDLSALPEDLSGFVLKPLFSFAGAGVVIDVTREAIARVPEAEREHWVLQDKITYAPALHTPAGNPVKAEIRVMLTRPPEDATFSPLLMLVRLSRGKMCGVDFNKDLDWVGGTIGMWPSSATSTRHGEI